MTVPQPMSYPSPARHLTGVAFALLAALLLLMTLHWRVPMMLWDHLDLVPIYAAWKDGTLGDSIFLRIHGGHIHTAAYAVLLATTELSHGRTWADCLASWLLLVSYAAIVFGFARASFDVSTRRGIAFMLLATLLALCPGHLSNLQWGWQVAVFLCLLGSVATIHLLTREALPAWRCVAAIAAGLLALASFATALALIPTSIALLALRTDFTIAKRIIAMLPWLVVGAAIACFYPAAPASSAVASPASLLLYTLNFLGGGLVRFAEPLAPWLAALGLASGFAAAVSTRSRLNALPWLGLFLFGAIAAAMTALGRAAAFGTDHAFVTRYVSFSSMFWLGWIGLAGCALRDRVPLPALARAGLWIVAVLVVANSLHLMHKAAGVAGKTRAIAAIVRSDYPRINRALLGEIYFDQPDVAAKRLSALHALGFAPFDGPPVPSVAAER